MHDLTFAVPTGAPASPRVRAYYERADPLDFEPTPVNFSPLHPSLV